MDARKLITEVKEVVRSPSTYPAIGTDLQPGIPTQRFKLATRVPWDIGAGLKVTGETGSRSWLRHSRQKVLLKARSADLEQSDLELRSGILQMVRTAHPTPEP